MKKLLFIFLSILLVFGCATFDTKQKSATDLERLAEGAKAASKVRPYHTLIGNVSGSVDSTDTIDLTDGDISFVVTGGGDFYLYQYESTATNQTNSPFYIRPHDYTSEGVHTLINSIATFPSTSPCWNFRDLDATAFDANGTICVQCTDVGDGTEDCDLVFSVQEAGTITAKITIDADGDVILHDDVSFTDKSIKLNDDSSLSMEGTEDGMDEDDYNGVTIRGRTCGENLLQWDLVVLKNDTDEFHKADADVAGEYPAVGIAVAACTDGGSVEVMTKGIVRNDGWTLTPGGTLYLGTNAGEILVSAPSVAGNYVQPVGWALDGDHIYFDFGRTGDTKATGTGAPVRATSPALVTPDIGAATGASLILTGKVQGAIETIGTWSSPTTTNPYSPTAAAIRSAVLYYGATGTINLPDASDGDCILIYNTGAFTITINPNDAEYIVREGTAQAVGISITLSSGAGNYVALVSDGTYWTTVGVNGTLAQGS